MENLWQRMKPTLKKNILDQQDLYPYSINALKDELQASYWWQDLPVSTVRSVINFSHENIFELSYVDILEGRKFINKL